MSLKFSMDDDGTQNGVGKLKPFEKQIKEQLEKPSLWDQSVFKAQIVKKFHIKLPTIKDGKKESSKNMDQLQKLNRAESQVNELMSPL